MCTQQKTALLGRVQGPSPRYQALDSSARIGLRKSLSKNDDEDDMIHCIALL